MTPATVAASILRLEALASMLTRRGDPLSDLPSRAEIADEMVTLCAFARRSFDPVWLRRFVATQVTDNLNVDHKDCS